MVLFRGESHSRAGARVQGTSFRPSARKVPFHRCKQQQLSQCHHRRPRRRLSEIPESFCFSVDFDVTDEAMIPLLASVAYRHLLMSARVSPVSSASQEVHPHL